MKNFKWDEAKNKKIKEERGSSFEEIIKSKLIGVVKHPTRVKQRFLLFEHKEYVWVVPCVVEKDHLFIKTMFPSRKYMRKYERGEIK